VLPLFDLRAYQAPSGMDFRLLQQSAPTPARGQKINES
jgi:hypothetical protein